MHFVDGILETPPHTQGKSRNEELKQFEQRNTPAYAGKICRTSDCSEYAEKHPRIRRENRTRGNWYVQTAETPPHTQGKCGPCV